MPETNHFLPVALEHASRLINHGPTVLIASSDGTRRNVMAAAWSMPVEFTPPRVAVVIDKNTFTRELVSASGTFAICLPGSALIDMTYAVGSTSGRDMDKFKHFGIDTESTPVLGLPVPTSGCSAWLECRLIPERHCEDAYDTCFAEVVGAAADARIFRDGHWLFDSGNADLQTIHHLGGGNFVCAGNVFRATGA
jgi:flavin reductase (DIM6/NTAB) family NADH-FMN oxidoreductase RutF